jgi:hypothetical protein
MLREGVGPRTQSGGSAREPERLMGQRGVRCRRGWRVRTRGRTWCSEEAMRRTRQRGLHHAQADAWTCHTYGRRTRIRVDHAKSCWLRQHAPRLRREARLVVGVVESDAKARCECRESIHAQALLAQRLRRATRKAQTHACPRAASMPPGVASTDGERSWWAHDPRRSSECDALTTGCAHEARSGPWLTPVSLRDAQRRRRFKSMSEKEVRPQRE